MDKLSYALGIGIGSQLAGMGAKELNIDDFAQAIKDVTMQKHRLSYKTSSKSRRLSSRLQPLRLVRQQRLLVRLSLLRMVRRMVL